MQDAPCPTLQRLLEMSDAERALGPYRLVQQLGHGGFAPVWLAREVHGEKEFRTVAIKLFCVEEDATGARGYTRAAREQIFDEARALCQVEHPNIVRFYNFQTDDSKAVLGLVMEYARGESVDKRLNEHGKLTLKETVALGIAVASALAEVHGVGLVHRDVKPANVVLDASGVYKLIDFGIAAGDPRSRRGGAAERIVIDDLPLDVKGTKLLALASTMLARGDSTFAGMAAGDMPSGTLGYLDPDCIAHLSRASPASDLYSLAAMLYECVAGLVPAAAAAAIAGRGGLLPEVVDGREPAPPLLEVEPEAPPALAKLVDALLAASPIDRPSSAAQVKRELEAIRDDLHAAPAKPPPQAPTSTAGTSARAAPVVAFLVVVAAFVGVWRLVRTPPPIDPLPAASGASIAPPASTSADAEAPVEITEPAWARALAEGQASLGRGDTTGALEKFSQAEEAGGGAVARAFVENVSAATAVASKCALAAFSHPRLGVSGKASRPSVAPAAPSGAIVVWTDDHDSPGHEHAYSVKVDETGHPVTKIRDLTPEGDRVFRPSLFPADDRTVLLYWDASGQYPGVRARWLSADGRIAGPSVLVDPGRPGNLWPTLERTPDGFVVAWQDDRNHDGDEVYLRKLDRTLSPLGNEAQATAVGGRDASAHTPSLARAEDSLLVAYVLEHDDSRVIKVRRFALASDDAPLRAGGGEQLAVLGDARAAPEGPQVACGADGCFVVWHAAQGAASVALIDPAKKRVRWTKRFSPRAAHPAIAIAPDGEAAVVYFDAGLVRVARVDANGVGPASVIGKVAGDPPRPSLMAGRAQGEWVAAWLGQEDGHAEPYVARVTCKE